MAKKKTKLGGIIGMILGIIVIIAIGGFFTIGGFMEVPILKLLPLIVHRIVGWILIVGAIISGILSLIE